jgi:antitoxin VapB
MSDVAKVFKNGRSQAIRLPKEFRVDTTEVYIEKMGDSLIITPKRQSRWDSMRKALEDMEEFELERNQPIMQERDLF